MTAPVIDLEKWVAQKNNKGHAERDDRAAFAQVSRQSIASFEAGLARKLDLTRKGIDLSGDVGALEGAFTRQSLEFFHRLHQVHASNVSLTLTVADFWTQVASNILRQSRELLHRAMSVSSLPSFTTMEQGNARKKSPKGGKFPHECVSREG